MRLHDGRECLTPEHGHQPEGGHALHQLPPPLVDLPLHRRVEAAVLDLVHVRVEPRLQLLPPRHQLLEAAHASFDLLGRRMRTRAVLCPRLAVAVAEKPLHLRRGSLFVVGGGTGGEVFPEVLGVCCCFC